MVDFTRRTLLATAAAAVALPTFGRQLFAQSNWPSRPIRIVVPYPAGAQTDAFARTIGEYLSGQLGQPVIVENRPGAGGMVGVTEVKNAANDGYTILCTLSSSIIQNRATIKDLPYDPDKDFVYLTSLNPTAGGAFVASSKTGATNLKEFVEYAKKQGTVNFGAYGPGSMSQILIATLARQYGFEYEVIQYQGAAPMWADIAAQVLDGGAASFNDGISVVQSGRGQLIAVVHGPRHPRSPETPTLIEQGAKDPYHETNPFSLFAVKARTPPEIVDRLSALLIQSGSDPTVQKVLANYTYGAPTDMAFANELIKRDTSILLPLLSELGIEAK